MDRFVVSGVGLNSEIFLSHLSGGGVLRGLGRRILSQPPQRRWSLVWAYGNSLPVLR